MRYLCFSLLAFALLCFALLCFAFLAVALLCFALLREQEGVEVMLECGPGKVQTGLGKRIDKTIVTAAINDSASLQSALDM